MGWWLLSPLFINETVDEEFPYSTAAVVPPDMTPAEVEEVMAGMAKMEQPIEEAMPAMPAPSAPAMPSSATAPAAPTALAGPTPLKTGMFRDADRFHKGSGAATLYRVDEDSHVLRFEDFRVTNGPDLHVLLTNHADPQSRDDLQAAGYVDLGSLKGNIGSQNYEIPAEVDLGGVASVVIYCQPFHVVFSVAPLQTAGLVCQPRLRINPNRHRLIQQYYAASAQTCS